MSYTCEHFFGPFLGQDVQVLQWHHNPFDTSEHGGEPQAEEHDEEEHRPKGGKGHLYDGLGEHDEGQSSSFNPLESEHSTNCIK